MASTSATVAPNAKGKARKYVGVNLFIKNLDASFNDEMLWDLFHAYGAIISCKVQLNADGTSKCFGFVCYATANEASLAIAELNGRVIGSKPLYVNLFESKEERMKSRLQKAIEYSSAPGGHNTYEEFLQYSEGRGRGRGRGRISQLQLRTEMSEAVNACVPQVPLMSPGLPQAAHFQFSFPGASVPPGLPQTAVSSLGHSMSPRLPQPAHYRFPSSPRSQMFAGYETPSNQRNAVRGPNTNVSNYDGPEYSSPMTYKTDK